MTELGPKVLAEQRDEAGGVPRRVDSMIFQLEVWCDNRRQSARSSARP